jgi:hypothetical protein
MIKNILEMLSVTEYYGESENIEIAKGKYALPKSVKQVFEQTRREVKMNLAKKDGRTQN